MEVLWVEFSLSKDMLEALTPSTLEVAKLEDRAFKEVIKLK